MSKSKEMKQKKPYNKGSVVEVLKIKKYQKKNLEKFSLQVHKPHQVEICNPWEFVIVDEED